MGIERSPPTVILTLCMLGNVSCFCCHLLIFVKINFCTKLFQGHYQSVKQFGTRSGQRLSGLSWVQTICKCYQQTTKFVTMFNEGCSIGVIFQTYLKTIENVDSCSCLLHTFFVCLRFYVPVNSYMYGHVERVCSPNGKLD